MRPLVRSALTVTLVAATVGLGAGPVGAQSARSAVAPPRIVPFDQWAPPGCPAPTGADVAPTTRVVVHHSHDPVASTRSDVAPALAEICTRHLARGFDTIGYHYVVDPWGTIYQGRGILPDAAGRAPVAQPEGAHVHGSNPGATGVVFLGDHEAEPPTTAAVDAAVRLLTWLVAATGRDPAELVAIESSGGGSARYEGSVEVEVLAGHNATNATLCPGEHLVRLLGPIRERVRATIAGGDGTLLVTDAVEPAPDGVARLTGSGPILPAPPPLPPLRTRPGLLGLVGTTLVLGLLRAGVWAHHSRFPRRDPTGPSDVWAGWD